MTYPAPAQPTDFNPRWYHVRIRLANKEVIEVFNLSESSLKRGFVVPFKQNRKFFFAEQRIDPTDIEGIRIITSGSSKSSHFSNPTFDSILQYSEDVTYEFINDSSEDFTKKVEESAKKAITEKDVIVPTTKVFIVHGHDNSSKRELSDFLFRLGLEPIILHEEANEGKTIIEKFENYSSDVRYAFVLLTPDDIAGSNKQDVKPRARQNVILELGYFMGKLGRDRVCGLYKKGIELPSDVLGILYLAFDNDITERRFDIVQELDRAGYKINFKQ